MQYQVLALGLPDTLFLFLKERLIQANADLVLALDIRDASHLCVEQTFHLIVIQPSFPAPCAPFLRALRRVSFAPIVLLIDPGTGQETVTANLEYGADLCLMNDIQPDLMCSYLFAQLRRYTRYNHYDQPESLNASPIQVGDLMIDPIRYEVQVKGNSVTLRHREFSLLLYFMRNPGIVLSTEQICEHAWGMEGGYNQGVSQPVRMLRQVIEPDPKNPIYIETVHRVGYRFTGCST